MISYRLLQLSDDVTELNALLRAAYRALAEAGMRYAASYEDVDATRRHIKVGECHVAVSDGKLVGCVVLRLPERTERTGWKAKRPVWYEQPKVANFGRFAVLPEMQGQGVGSKLMDRIEARAREMGFDELALDTSENAKHLIEMYEARGYRFIDFHQWDVTNYRSVVMSKKL